MVRLDLTSDAALFLAGAREHLALDPVLNTVVATIAERHAGSPGPADDWWATICDGDRVVGVAMRTAPFSPRPAYVLPMPQEAALLLARALHARGEDLTQVNGALPVATALLGELGRLTGRSARVVQHSRLFELRAVVAPRPVQGRLRTARREDAELVEAWFTAFFHDADEQAGRPGRDHVGHVGHVVSDDIEHRIESGRVWLWEDDQGRVVHLSGVNPPAFGAARIGPVYTPREQRGQGWASAAVATLSQRILDAGARPCLFTDQANPTSNAIYQALGYEAVVDTADVVLV